MWIFAYGSLIFRPSFEYVTRRPAFARGWSRRFWQGSPDHRGVPEAPGRVVTLIESPGTMCGGAGYAIDPRHAEAILEELDAREQAGFERVTVVLHDAPGGAPFAEALTYIAPRHNPWFLGELHEEAIADVVRTRRGPSGENLEYVEKLHASLRELGIVDDHVEAIVRHLSVRA